jgi:hypothetical protein
MISRDTGSVPGESWKLEPASFKWKNAWLACCIWLAVSGLGLHAISRYRRSEGDVSGTRARDERGD